MCLSPNLIINRHYLKICDNDKSRVLSHFGSAPDLFIKVDCGLCFECQKKRGNHWRTRLLDEYHYRRKMYPDEKVSFITLTFDTPSLKRFRDCPEKAVRLFLERYRKRYGKSVRHFITTEFGEKRGRLHLHMIAWSPLCNAKELRLLWSYGRIDMQTLKGPQGLTYVSGYITKVVQGGKLSSNIPLFIDYEKKTKCFVSPGFGKQFIFDPEKRNLVYQKGTPHYVGVRDNGSPFAYPRYYYRIFSPLDLIRKKQSYFADTLQLPQPPYKVLNRYFDDFGQYLDYLHSLNGNCVLLPIQFTQLNLNLQNKILWQTTKSRRSSICDSPSPSVLTSTWDE